MSTNTYTYTVELKVTVECFDESDAEDILDETFGPGEDCGVTIISTHYSKE